MKPSILIAVLAVISQGCALRIPGISIGGSQSATSSGGSSVGSPADLLEAAEMKKHAKRLRDLAIITTQAGVKADDSYSLEKVQQAFARIDSKQVVVLTKESLARWSPGPEVNVEHNRYKAAAPCPSTGLGAFGADYLREESGFGAIRLEYDLCNRSESEPIDFDHLAQGTAGVIWSAELVDGGGRNVRSKIVFVTLDGGRYLMEELHWEPSNFEQKVPTVFPKTSRHAFLGQREFELLAKTGDAGAKEAKAKLSEAKTAWDACMKPVLDKEDAEYEQNAAEAFSDSQRQGKNQLTAKKFSELRENTCGKFKKQLTQHLVQRLSERESMRTKLLAENQARLAKAP